MPSIELPELAEWVRRRSGGEPPAALLSLAAELSSRTFLRVTWRDANRPDRILMIADPARERNAAFLRLAPALRARGLTVPRIIASDSRRGRFLLEDLGSVHPPGNGSDAAAARERIIRTLARWQARTQDLAAAGPHYSRARFEFELGLFETHYCDAFAAGQRPPDWSRQRDLLVANQCLGPRVLVHRDWHVRNLLLLPDGRVGIVDFQDAVRGPLLYDLASLVHDVYADHTADAIADLRAAWLRAIRREGLSPPPDLDARFARCALQRLLKILGQFARAAVERPELSHGRLIDRVAARAASLARELDWDALADWLDRTRTQSAAPGPRTPARRTP